MNVEGCVLFVCFYFRYALRLFLVFFLFVLNLKKDYFLKVFQFFFTLQLLFHPSSVQSLYLPIFRGSL